MVEKKIIRTMEQIIVPTNFENKIITTVRDTYGYFMFLGQKLCFTRIVGETGGGYTVTEYKTGLNCLRNKSYPTLEKAMKECIDYIEAIGQTPKTIAKIISEQPQYNTGKAPTSNTTVNQKPKLEFPWCVLF